MLLLLGLGAELGRSWSWLTAAAGAAALATAAAYADSAFGVVDVLLVATGVLVIPAWLVATGRRLGSASRQKQNATRSRPAAAIGTR